MIIIQELLIIVKDFKTLFCYSEFPWAREKISSKFINYLVTHLNKIRRFCLRVMSDVEKF
jgi:hypothetical protein